jgi:hypothetical protein
MRTSLVTRETSFTGGTSVGPYADDSRFTSNESREQR